MADDTPLWPRGWALPVPNLDPVTWHYFVETQSICGEWIGYVGQVRQRLPGGAVRCSVCRDRLQEVR
jgi:hypothetical protein